MTSPRTPWECHRIKMPLLDGKSHPAGAVGFLALYSSLNP